MNNFGTRLKECRKAKGYTQDELGKKVGMSAQKISNIERGYTTGLGMNDVAIFCTALDVTSDYLVNGGNRLSGTDPVETELSGDYIFIAGKNGVRKKIPVPADKLERFKKLVEAGLPELLDDEDL